MSSLGPEAAPTQPDELLLDFANFCRERAEAYPQASDDRTIRVTTAEAAEYYSDVADAFPEEITLTLMGIHKQYIRRVHSTPFGERLQTIGDEFAQSAGLSEEAVEHLRNSL